MNVHVIRVFFSSLAIIASLAIGSAGCGTASQKVLRDDHGSHSHYARLELNEGKKWVVHKPMMAHIRRIETRVLESNVTPVNDHKALAAGIQENLGRLVTNCTMEGKAHDELHKWLIPFLATAQAYSDATQPATQEQQLQEIKQALLVFNEYFQ